MSHRIDAIMVRNNYVQMDVARDTGGNVSITIPVAMDDPKVVALVDAAEALLKWNGERLDAQASGGATDLFIL